MATLFVSDLHLSAERKPVTDSFLAFLAGIAREAEGLYILGDLFDRWLGDDAAQPEDRRVLTALRTLTASGVPLWVMSGNHDFLYSSRFASETGCELLPDPYVLDLYGTKTLLMHGDLLCTNDIPYQNFRKMVRDPAWQATQLAKPVAARLEMARELLSLSHIHTAAKDDATLAVNQDAVESRLRAYDAQLLIHGHTHRPNHHCFLLDGKEALRIVLPDWHMNESTGKTDKETGYERGGYLRVTAHKRETLPLTS